jgi:hypothetical protein
LLVIRPDKSEVRHILNTYYLTEPILRQSTKKYSIFDHENKKIGEWQRFYKNKFEFICDKIFDHFYFNLRVYDERSQVRVTSMQKANLFKDVWEIKEGGQSYTLRNTTKIKTHPRYILEYQNDEFIIMKDFADRFIRIKNRTNHELICEAKSLRLTPPGKTAIKIINPVLDIYLTACLIQTLSLQH